MGLLAAACLLVPALFAGSASAAQLAVSLGAADGFAVPAGSTVTNGVTLNGRALARNGAVTLINDTINAPHPMPIPPPTPNPCGLGAVRPTKVTDMIHVRYAKGANPIGGDSGGPTGRGSDHKSARSNAKR